MDYAGPIRDHIAESDFVADRRDSSSSVPLSVVVPIRPRRRPLRQAVPLADTVLYELHVKGYTQLHPAVPEHLRGTYAGLAYPAVIEHLLDLGVTSVELLPVQHFVSEPFLIGRGLSNFWGYNTLGFFAPHAAYCSVGTMGQQVREFKEMVCAFHDAGIEVILDVVYNHTGEGGHEGPTLAFRGIDHAGYYRLDRQPAQRLRRHRLRQLRGHLRARGAADGAGLAALLGHRDGRRRLPLRPGHHLVPRRRASRRLLHHPFSEALRNDPVLSRTKLIAEPWDLGPYGYQLGAFGPTTGASGTTGSATTSATSGGATPTASRSWPYGWPGSPDIFDRDGRGSTSSVNFVTAHDGFTLRDLVTYNVKHNGANGESNRDGTDDNRSWNCGYEGETDDAGDQRPAACGRRRI